MKPFTRRRLLQGAGLTLLGASLPPLGRAQPGAAGAEGEDGAVPSRDAASPPDASPLNRYPRAVQEYYIRRVREVEQARNARRAALRTKADAERYVAEVRERFQGVFGPFPARTPLNPRITAVHERDSYRIENVIFESRPGFLVTANLYVPRNQNRPLPGVLGCCGHANSGKALTAYQLFAQGLARQGYVTLIFDPIGEGERLQYTNQRLGPKYGFGTAEHTYAGVRLTLAGEHLGTWFAWDGIRAIDYLISRPEVDPRHLGVTGNSGGGGQTTWLCALDRRITMAAPSCFVTTMRRNIENENSQDPEQFPPHLLALGLDHSDAIAAMAPNPVKILGQEKDFFDARGFEEAAARLRHLYQLLGAEQNFDSFLGDGYHGFSKSNREAMYGWFNSQTGKSHGSSEPTLRPEKADVLRCTPHGQVAELGSTSLFSLGGMQSKRWREGRNPLRGAELKRAIAATLMLPSRAGAPDYKILREAPSRGYVTPAFANYIVESEPGIPVVTIRLSQMPLPSRIPRGFKRALLYVSHRGADAEMRTDPWVRRLCAAGSDTAVFACDLRGVGDSQPRLSTPANPTKGGADYFHAGCGLLFDCPTAGQRTHDLLRLLDLLSATGHGEIHLAARGWGAIPATFAAVLHESVKQVTLKHALTSYAAIMESEDYHWPLSSLVPDVLKTFDLPDCYEQLMKKRLELIEPVSAEGVPD
ncbi:MAG TPA: acetylxylan esterase [Opitutaceae bacterium]|nr:acetylxylan esterase [Opitutaceae bacterium]